jgi:hypothetical protein
MHSTGTWSARAPRLRLRARAGRMLSLRDARAVGLIVAVIGHRTAVITDPFALDINVLDRDGLAQGTVGGDPLEFVHRFGIALGARRPWRSANLDARSRVRRSVDRRRYRRKATRGDAAPAATPESCPRLWPSRNILSLPNSLRAHAAISSVSAIMRSLVRVGATFAGSVRR